MADQHLDPDSLLTSRQAGVLLQVDPTSIKNWVKAGHIEAFHTPGGHLRIRAADLVQFLSAHNMPIPTELRSLARRRLLIVDDDPKQLRAFRRLLKPHAAHVQVELVENGIDALVRVGAFRPHLIVLDVFMPDLDGLEVCRRLKSNTDTKDINVVIASGGLTAEIEKTAFKAGASRCLHKPIELRPILDDLAVPAEPQRSSNRTRA